MHVGARGCGLLRGPEREGALRGKCPGGLARLSHELVRLEDSVDEPDAKRLLGVDRRPVRISSFAGRSRRRGSLCVPPQPGMIPRLTSGWPSLAARTLAESHAARARSLRRARTRSPRRSSASASSRAATQTRAELAPRRAPSTSTPLMYLMSAPATKALSPAPVSTTTARRSSPASSSSRSRSSVSVGRSSAFSASGRSTVTVATASSRATGITRRSLVLRRVHHRRRHLVDDPLLEVRRPSHDGAVGIAERLPDSMVCSSPRSEEDVGSKRRMERT